MSAPSGDAARSRLARAARLAVTLGLLALLAARVDLASVGAILASIDPRLVFAAYLTSLVDRLLMIVKWYPLLRHQDPGIPFGIAARAYMASQFASLVLPTSVGGDAVRAWILGRGRGRVVEVGASIVVERVLGLLAASILAILSVGAALHVALPVSFMVPWIVGTIGLGFACLLLPLAPGLTGVFAGLTRGWTTRWTGLAHRFISAWGMYREEAGTLLVCGLLSLVQQMFPIVCLLILDRALGTGIGALPIVISVPLAMIAGRLPVSIAGLGVTEGALVYLLGLFGVDPARALALGLSGTLIAFAVGVTGGVFWCGLRRRMREV